VFAVAVIDVCVNVTDVWVAVVVLVPVSVVLVSVSVADVTVVRVSVVVVEVAVVEEMQLNRRSYAANALLRVSVGGSEKRSHACSLSRYVKKTQSAFKEHNIAHLLTSLVLARFIRKLLSACRLKGNFSYPSTPSTHEF
jgi:hypothetical protein